MQGPPVGSLMVTAKPGVETFRTVPAGSPPMLNSWLPAGQHNGRHCSTQARVAWCACMLLKALHNTVQSSKKQVRTAECNGPQDVCSCCHSDSCHAGIGSHCSRGWSCKQAWRHLLWLNDLICTEYSSSSKPSSSQWHSVRQATGQCRHAAHVSGAVQACINHARQLRQLAHVNLQWVHLTHLALQVVEGVAALLH